MKRALVLFLALVSLPAAAKTVTGSASFVAKAKPPMLTAWDLAGRGGKVSGTVDDSGKGTLTVQLKDLSTDMSQRDEHMRSYLETEKFPEAKLTVDSASGGSFAGSLTLHGVTHPVSGKAAVTGSHAHCEFTVKLSDYGLPKLEKMGIVVQDEVAVTAEVDAK